MSTGHLALLLGLFAVPALLLWLGHRLHRRSARVRGAFWGGAVGHTLAMCAATVAAMYPPAAWTGGEVARGVLGFGAMLGGGLIGAVLGAFMAVLPPDAMPASGELIHQRKSPDLPKQGWPRPRR